jgi:hypothetical protein
MQVNRRSSETSGDLQRTTWRYISEDSTLHTHRCENLKSLKEKKFKLDIFCIYLTRKNDFGVNSRNRIWRIIRQRETSWICESMYPRPSVVEGENWYVFFYSACSDSNQDRWKFSFQFFNWMKLVSAHTGFQIPLQM